MRPFPPSVSRVSRAILVVAALGLGAVGFVACSGDPVPRDSYYRLTAASDPAPRVGGPLSGAVEVQPFRADGLLNNRAILFRQGASAVDAYSYHFWWQAPGTMLQQSLIDALRKARAFDAAAGPEMRVNRDHEVLGRIRRLEQNGASVVVEIEISFRSGKGGAPLLLKTYTEEVAAADDTVPAAVAAFSTAISRVWAAFIVDLGAIEPAAKS